MATRERRPDDLASGAPGYESGDSGNHPQADVSPALDYPADPANLPPDAAISELLQELGSQTGQIVVYRKPPGVGEREYRCDTVPLEGFDIDQLARRYGGGVYRMIVRVAPRPGAKPVIRHNLTIHIDPRIPGTIGAENERPSIYYPKTGAPENEVSVLVTELRELGASLKSMRPAPAADLAGAIPSELLKIMLDMFRGAQATAGKGPVAELMEAVKIGIDIGRGASADGNAAETPWWVNSVTEIAGRVLQGAMQTPQPSTGGRPALPAAPPATGPAMPAAGGAPPAPPRPGVIGLVERYLPQMLEHARHGTDPAVSADWIAALVESEPSATVGLASPPPLLYSELLAGHPEIQAYSGWWRDFFVELIQAFNEPADDEPVAN